MSTSEKEAEILKELAAVGAQKHNQDAQDRFDSAVAKLVAFKPIFGTVFMFLNKKQSRQIPTMGVGIIRRVDLGLFYNPEWIMTLTSGELRAVLQHEALHILLHHIVRSTYFGYDHKGYNVAADMAINCHIANLPKGCFYPSTFKMPDFESAEWYYEKIREEIEKNGGDASKVLEGRGGLVDSHDGWGEAEDDVVKEKIKGIAEKCIKAQEEKGWSDIGSGLAKAIIDANKPTINWKREVRYFINKMVLSGAKYTRTRLNRREQAGKVNREDSDFLKKVYIQPGTKRDHRSKLLVALDCSGSVSDRELQAFVGEINGMVEHVECHVTMFDTQMLCEPFPIAKKVSDLEILGRGGTNFEPVIRYAEAHNYDGLIMFTDGFCPFPDPPKGVRVLWGITPPGDSVIPPYGKRVRIEIKEIK